MIKVIELIIVLALLIFSFFTGVKYSDQVKERASWLFETKEEATRIQLQLSQSKKTQQIVKVIPEGSGTYKDYKLNKRGTDYDLY